MQQLCGVEQRAGGSGGTSRDGRLQRVRLWRVERAERDEAARRAAAGEEAGSGGGGERGRVARGRAHSFSGAALPKLLSPGPALASSPSTARRQPPTTLP